MPEQQKNAPATIEADPTNAGPDMDPLARFSQSTSNLPVPAGAAMPSRANARSGVIMGAQAVAVKRDEEAVLKRISVLAAAAGPAWFYRYPVRDRRRNTQSWIEGPSIKLCNDLARIYGNCEITVVVDDLGDSFLITARFNDIETGFAMERPFQQSKSGARIGGGDDDRRMDMALQIGTSKAIRNVVRNALQTYADFAFEEAKASLVEKIGKRLEEYRTRIQAHIEEVHQIEFLRVERVIGRSLERWTAPDVMKAFAMSRSIEDGMATIDDTFPPLSEEVPEGRESNETAINEFVDEGGKDEKKSAKTTDAKAQAKPKSKAKGKANADKPAEKPAEKPADDTAVDTTKVEAETGAAASETKGTVTDEQRQNAEAKPEEDREIDEISKQERGGLVNLHTTLAGFEDQQFPKAHEAYKEHFGQWKSQTAKAAAAEINRLHMERMAGKLSADKVKERVVDMLGDVELPD